jgi:hypothetical protein
MDPMGCSSYSSGVSLVMADNIRYSLVIRTLPEKLTDATFSR